MFPFNQIVYHYVEQHGPEHGSASDFSALWKPTIYSCFNIFVINSPCKAVGFLKMPLRYPVINLTVFHKGYQPIFFHSRDCHLTNTLEFSSFYFICTESCVFCSAAVFNTQVPTDHSLYFSFHCLKLPPLQIPD